MHIATSLAEIAAEHGERLLSLRGKRVVRSWVVFYRPLGALHECTPVVLELDDGARLELWTIYVAEFGVTWNEVDLAGQPFAWNGQPDPDSQWVVDGDPALAAVVPNTISDVRLLRCGRGNITCIGVELSFEDGQRLVVANSCDEVLLTNRASDPSLEPVPWEELDVHRNP